MTRYPHIRSFAFQVALLTSLFSASRLWPHTTWWAAVVALVGLCAFFWWEGGKK